jgi:hypothetical protein
VEACEPPRRLLLTTRETDESYHRGQGVPPFDGAIEVTLTSDGGQTILVIEIRGMPLDKIAFYGAGWQIHMEHLEAHLAGHEYGDSEARWEALVPPYQELAATMDQWPLAALSMASQRPVERSEPQSRWCIQTLGSK